MQVPPHCPWLIPRQALEAGQALFPPTPGQGSLLEAWLPESESSGLYGEWIGMPSQGTVLRTSRRFTRRGEEESERVSPLPKVRSFDRWRLRRPQELRRKTGLAAIPIWVAD